VVLCRVAAWAEPRHDGDRLEIPLGIAGVILRRVNVAPDEEHIERLASRKDHEVARVLGDRLELRVRNWLGRVEPEHRCLFECQTHRGIAARGCGHPKAQLDLDPINRAKRNRRRVAVPDPEVLEGADRELLEAASDGPHARLLNAATTARDRVALLLLLDLGIRRSELTGVRPGDIDLGRRQITVFGKGQKSRVIPLRGRVVLEIEGYLLEPLPLLGRSPEPDDFLLYPEKRTGANKLLAAYPKRRMIA
jgi:integrase